MGCDNPKCKCTICTNNECACNGTRQCTCMPEDMTCCCDKQEKFTNKH